MIARRSVRGAVALCVALCVACVVAASPHARHPGMTVVSVCVDPDADAVELSEAAVPVAAGVHVVSGAQCTCKLFAGGDGHPRVGQSPLASLTGHARAETHDISCQVPRALDEGAYSLAARCGSLQAFARVRASVCAESESRAPRLAGKHVVAVHTCLARRAPFALASHVGLFARTPKSWQTLCEYSDTDYTIALKFDNAAKPATTTVTMTNADTGASVKTDTGVAVSNCDPKGKDCQCPWQLPSTLKSGTYLVDVDVDFELVLYAKALPCQQLQLTDMQGNPREFTEADDIKVKTDACGDTSGAPREAIVPLYDNIPTMGQNCTIKDASGAVISCQPLDLKKDIDCMVPRTPCLRYQAHCKLPETLPVGSYQITVDCACGGKTPAKLVSAPCVEPPPPPPPPPPPEPTNVTAAPASKTGAIAAVAAAVAACAALALLWWYRRPKPIPKPPPPPPAEVLGVAPAPVPEPLPVEKPPPPPAKAPAKKWANVETNKYIWARDGGTARPVPIKWGELGQAGCGGELQGFGDDGKTEEEAAAEFQKEEEKKPAPGPKAASNGSLGLMGCLPCFSRPKGPSTLNKMEKRVEMQ